MSNYYAFEAGCHSRAISFENPDGRAGSGAMAASPLGVGRKGSPARMIAPGETAVLADIQGPGVIRHIWLATYDVPVILRSLTLRAHWDDQEHPSIEAPLGDFFGFAHGRSTPYASAVHSIGEKGALNMWLPMPFRKRGRLTLTNELPIPALLFFQIDYTVGNAIPDDAGYLHALFRRECRTTPGRDFELLPRRVGRGRFMGSVIGVVPLEPHWWGEGEVKFFMDGDEEHATIVGTGSEDYVGLAWCVQQTTFDFHGASLVEKGPAPNMAGPVSMYRWHLPDPVYWHDAIRVTIQQIGCDISAEGALRNFDSYLECLRERQDDWSCCTFWYESVPSAPLPELPPLEVRLHAIDRSVDLARLPLQAGFSAARTL